MRTVWVLLTQAILLLLVVVLIPVEAQSAELDGLIEPYMVTNVGSGVRGTMWGEGGWRGMWVDIVTIIFLIVY